MDDELALLVGGADLASSSARTDAGAEADGSTPTLGLSGAGRL